MGEKTDTEQTLEKLEKVNSQHENMFQEFQTVSNQHSKMMEAFTKVQVDHDKMAKDLEDIKKMLKTITEDQAKTA